MPTEGIRTRFATRLIGCFALALASLPAQDPFVVPDEPFAALRAMPAQPAVEEGLVVKVRSADGEPLPNAVVAVVPIIKRGQRSVQPACNRKFPGDEPLSAAAFATSGTRYAVDEHGNTRIPNKLGHVIAIHGTDVASTEARPSKTRAMELQVQPAFTFTALVRKATGAPAANAPVEIISRNAGATRVRTTTDIHGNATFRLVGGSPTRSRRVRAVIAARKATITKLPTAAGGSATLTLPPCGSVTAKLSHSLPPGTTCKWTMRSDKGATAEGVSDPDDPSKVTFPFVEAGTEGRISCFILDSIMRQADFAAVEVDKPQVIEMPSTNEAVMFVRVLTPTGQPLRKTWVHYEWDYPRGSSSSGVRTNADGWIVLDVPKQVGKSSSLTLQATDKDWHGTLLGTTKIDIEKVTKPTDDRGAVKLTAPVMAVRGRLVDQTGSPVEGVRLQGRCDDSYDDYHATTADDGSFTLKTPGKTTTVSIALDTQDWFLKQNSERLEVDFGSTDLQIDVLRAARVKLNATGIDTSFRDNIDVHCEDPSDATAQFKLKFRWRKKSFRMPAGTWDIVFSCGGEEFHRIDNVIAQSGIEVHDPRFMFFDWQKFVTLVTIEVQDQQGKPFDDVTVWQHYEHGSSGSSPRKGIYRILLPKRGAPMSIQVDDRALGNRIELGTVTHDQIVRIDAGPRLLVELDALPELPEGTQLLAGCGDAWQPFEARRRAALWLPKVDRYRVQLAVQRGEQRIVVDQQLPATDVPTGGSKLAVSLDDALRRRVQHAVDQLK